MTASIQPRKRGARIAASVDVRDKHFKPLSGRKGGIFQLGYKKNKHRLPGRATRWLHHD